MRNPHMRPEKSGRRPVRSPMGTPRIHDISGSPPVNPPQTRAGGTAMTGAVLPVMPLAPMRSQTMAKCKPLNIEAFHISRAQQMIGS